VTWPAPGDIFEPQARHTCRAIILNTSFIGQSCFDRLGDDDSSTDIVEACVDDVQVCLAIPELDSLLLNTL